MRKAIKYILVICFLLEVLIQSVFATTELSSKDGASYTYNSKKQQISAPIAYYYYSKIDQQKLGVSLKNITDIETGKNSIYIVEESTQSLIWVDENLKLKKVVNSVGKGKFQGLSGVCVAPNENVYVCDRITGEIHIFTKDLDYINSFAPPPRESMYSNQNYEPIKLAVDDNLRVYVISKNQTQGILQLNNKGEFVGFLGATRVVPNAFDLFIRSISTKEQKKAMLRIIPTEYCNLTVDNKGFVYSTISALKDIDVYNDILSNSAVSAPIRKLNPKGIDVLVRNGAFPPVGDVAFPLLSNQTMDDFGASTIVDVAVKNEFIYTILDAKRNRFFSYDKNGNLLFVYAQNQDFIKKSSFNAIAYLREKILISDNYNECINIYNPTDYANLVFKAVDYNVTQSKKAEFELWEQLKKDYVGLEIAYLGLGKQQLLEGDYKKALENFKLANNKNYYSQALYLFRQQIGYKYGVQIFFILFALIVIFIILILLLKKNGVRFKIKNKLLKEILYAKYIMVRPFDGFWDLKAERKGSVLSATILLTLLMVVNVAKASISTFLFSNNDIDTTAVLQTAIGTLLIMFLWIIANWCFTNLMDGKGTFKQIYIFSCYSTFPMIVLTPVLIILQYFLTLDEYAVIVLISTIIYLWTGFLFYAGTLTTHQYTAGKGFATCGLTIIGMAILAFVILLCVNLVQQIIVFAINTYQELSMRF